MLSKFKKYDNSQNSPLHYAWTFGNLECVKILSEHGAEVNCLYNITKIHIIISKNIIFILNFHNGLVIWKNIPIELELLKKFYGIVKYLITTIYFQLIIILETEVNLLLKLIDIE